MSVLYSDFGAWTDKETRLLYCSFISFFSRWESRFFCY